MSVDRTRGGRTQAERSAASETALLRAAAQVIAECGVERASLRSIGARAGVSRAMPGYHFGSKDALLARLAERGVELTLNAAIAAVERNGRDADEMSQLEILQVMIESYLEVIASPDTPEERAVVVMWGATFAAESAAPALVESDRATHAGLAQRIRDGQDEGSIRKDVDAAAAAITVLGMARGVAAASLAHGSMAEAAEARVLCGETILNALRPTDEPRPPRWGHRG